MMPSVVLKSQKIEDYPKQGIIQRHFLDTFCQTREERASIDVNC